MSNSPRRAFVVLTAVAVLGSAACLQTAFAQKAAVKGVVALPIIVNPQPVGGSADAASFDLPKDTQARRSIEAAHDYIEAKQWDKVVEALQRILDDPQDKFAPLPRKGPDGKEVVVPTSVRAEANRLLANLPKEGFEAYKTFKDAGPRADEYLKKARDAATVDERLANLGLVVRNYLHTDAGGEAADLLATHYMDRGDFRTAGRFYGLLMTRAGGLDALPADMLFRAAYAFDQADDKADEELVWQSARSRGIREVKFGDDAKSVSDLQDYLNGLAHAVDAVGRQWAYFLGDASHTGKGDGGPAFMRFNWKTPTAVYDLEDKADLEFAAKVSRLFEDASARSVQVHQPVLPPQFPVTAAVIRKDGSKHSLVVFRTHSGIAACDMAGGKMVGRNPIKGTLNWMMSDPGRDNILNQWTQAYIQQGQRPGIIFENTTIGTLSTDGELAYTVEDLGVPPPTGGRVNMAFPGMPNPYGWPPEILDAVNHSRLMAYDIAAGCKTVWEAPAVGDTKSELADSYFLGPPLCVNGKLYVLSEKQQELRLICLENVREIVGGVVKVTPKVDFVLPLGTARDSKIQQDPLRRVNAAHLSYGEGVLVCPTNLGYVIAIDLLQNSLLWAYPYRDKADEVEDANAGAGGPFKGGRLPVGMWNPNMGIPMPLAQPGWKASAPIIQDGKVVFTAPDSKSIHCVNLKDGTPVWSKPRQEGDLYLGAVVNGKVVVVGQKVVHAYNLSNGEKPWEPVETGLPSGFGAASENIYYVPLKESSAGKDPEICGVDVDRGVAVTHSKTRSSAITDPDHQNDTLGNLAFFDGAIVSQTNDGVYVYPQLKVKIADMTEKLKANPNDPQGLYDRGELSLEEGNLEGAVQDLRQVLRGGPPADLQVKAKDKLYEALTEDFQHNFDQAEKYQEDYAALCSRELPPTATDADRAEARRRRINYLYLIAKGREGQRKLTEAFDKYLELNAEAQQKDGVHAESQSDELLSLVDERLVKAAPDVLAQGRIAAMVAGASEAERKPLEARIAAKWTEIRAKNDLAELRKFVSLFGSLFTVGQEARLQLAERLMEDEKDSTALIDAERQLSLLRARTQDPELAARAVECLARLNTRKGLLEDAAFYYRLLRDRYPAVRVRDGKTGADLFNEMATDKRLWGELDVQPRFGASGKLKATEERDNFPVPQTFTFAQAGEALPYFQRYDVALQFGDNHLKLVDRTDRAAAGRDRPANDAHSVQLTNTMFQQILGMGGNNAQMFNPGFPGGPQVNTQPPPSPKFTYMNLGHLIVLPVGHMVFGIDAVQWKVLWEKNLFNPANGPASGAGTNQALQSVTVDPRDGSVQVVYQDQFMQRLGQTGPLGGAAVCLQMKDALTAVDPVSGRVLWTRSDVSTRSHIFGDDQYVFVVEMSQENKAAYTRVFRAYDGSSVPALDFHDPYENRIRLVGRDILTADKDKDAVTLRLYDPLTGKDLWKQAFAPKSYVLQAEDGDLAGVVEPDGQVRVVDLSTQKEVLTPLSKIDPKFLDKEATLTVLGDAMNVYIAPNGPLAAGMRVNTNLMPGAGLRGLNVNGELYAFRREADEKHAKGSVAWHMAQPNQQLVLNHFQEMPVMVLTAQVMKFQAPFGGMVNQTFPLMVIEKRTGIRKRENDNCPPAQFFALEENSRQGKIEFTSAMDKVVVSVESDKPAAPPSAP